MLTRTDALLLRWTLVAKLGVLVVGVLAAWVATGHAPGLLEPWDRWDAPHYTDIAVFGYMAHDPGNLVAPGYEQVFPGDLDLYIVFFPLFPWLVAGVNALIGAPVVAAFVVATVASLFVAPLLYRLVAVDLGDRIGRSSAVFLLVFPTAYFLHIGYTEGLFLALAFGSLWLARTDRWWGAGVLGGLAALARVNGLVLIPALLVEAWLQWRQHRRMRVSWLAIGGVAIGFGVYLALNWRVYGEPFAFSEIQHTHWFKQLSPPWEGIAGFVRWIRDDDLDTALMLGWAELIFTALGLVATVATAIWLRATWAVWMAGNWLLIVSTGFVMSVPRYSLVLFGIVVWMALIAQRWRTVGWVLAVCSVAAIGVFAWRFAAGQWAF
ncbi:MAG TPA: glycosyltransferase family 39 protein [Candidatus Limnocylindria bacterium]|nr:glycosyltransferase family 39 protein [Candidatus Limnocylindria bacterium]